MSFGRTLTPQNKAELVARWCKSSLKSLDGGNIGLEWFSQDVIVNARPKQDDRNRHNPCICTPKSRNRRHCQLPCVCIVLEVHQSLGKYKHVPCLQRLVEKLVSRVQKPNLQGTIDEEKKLCRARMGVGRGLVVPAGYWRTAKDTLCPIRAGNSSALAFVTLKLVGNGDPRTARMSIKVKKLPSTLEL
ncbi:hypothetical protein SLE2022_354290 [Rubroshorea leprosula]